MSFIDERPAACISGKFLRIVILRYFPEAARTQFVPPKAGLIREDCMVRCKKCKVPLTGFLSKLEKVLFSIRNSENDPQLCNKCDGKEKDKLYKCQICGRMIHEEHSLEHVKAEEYLINLIRKDHSHWRDREPTCEECVDYYRELIKKTEI